MSDYFFYDLNKKMADLANKQQLAETAQVTPANPAPSALRTQLNERDLGKHNNATTGFAALAKKTGGGEKGAKIAGAQLAKMRAKGQVEEGSKPDFLDLDKDGNRKEPMKSAARGAKKDVEEGVMDTLKKGYNKVTNTLGDIGIIPDELLSSPRRDKNGNWNKRTNPARNNFIDWIEDNPGLESHMAELLANFDNWVDDGNSDRAAGKKAVEMWKQRMKREKQSVSEPMRRHSMTEVNATPHHLDDPVSKPMAKASAANRSSSKRPDPNVPGSMIVVGKDTGPLPKRKTPTSAPDDEDGSTAPPAKGPDGRYPIVTAGPHKGKRWSPTTPGPTNPTMKETGGIPTTPKQKSFAKLAPPVNKITFADKIVGAKKEVDEMLGDVAANAMKKAVRGRNRDMEESNFDDTPTSRRSSSGGRIDTSEPGVTRHRAVKGNYSGAGHDASADDEPSGQLGRRKVGAGMGKKIGAKINRGTSKLMTKEGDMPEDMIEPQDSGEYDQEGDMAKDSIKTVVRHAQALEKILGDDDNLPEWVQSKLAKIENMMTAVDDYMQNQNDDDSGDDMEMEEERTNKRDSRAEKAGRKVAKDIEYDEKKKDGIHGKRRDSEDSKAERAGKKVTKDIEYDEKKDKKKDDKKEVDETTTSGSVATGGAAPKSSGGHNYGKGIYDSLNRQLENMISEGMNINMSMNNDDHGGPRKSLTVTATDEDAVMLAGLLKMAGMGSGDEHIHDMTDNDSQMLAIQTMGDEESCSSCGSSPCGCDDQMMDEAYGDTDATQNDPDYPTDQEGTDDAMMYSGGLNGPKSTGQTTIPVIAGQDDRMGYNGDHELRRMMEIAGLR